MALLQRVLTSFTLLLICTMIQASEFKNYSKIWPIKNGYKVFKGNDFDTPDNSILYASCKTQPDLENYHCDLIVDAPTEIKTCNLKFRRSEFSSDEKEIFVIDHLQRIKGNKIFIVYSFFKIIEDKPWVPMFTLDPVKLRVTMITTRVSVLNRSDCSMSELVEYNVKPGRQTIIDPLIYNNTFDVFVSNRSLCRNSYTCRISYDQTGEQMNKPIPFPIDIDVGQVIPITPASLLKGFFVRGHNTIPILEVKYVNPEGEVKTLIRDTLLKYDFANSKISIAHKMGGICYRNDEIQSYCIQFDSDGKMLANISMEIGTSEYFRGSYNVAKGQMLVFTESFDKNWTVRKITTQTLGKPLDLDFSCKTLNPLEYGVIVKETNDQFIFYLKCLEGTNDGESYPMHMKYSVQYVSKKYLLNEP